MAYLLEYANVVGVVVVGKVEHSLGGMLAQILEAPISIGDATRLGLLRLLVLLRHGRYGYRCGAMEVEVDGEVEMGAM